jgi:hypothetical protein
MLYAILCYHDENLVWSWSKEEEDTLMAKIGGVRADLTAQGKLGASLRLMPTTAATTLHKNQEPPLVIDGPFAETKEQLLGFYILDVENLEAALDAARQIAAVNPGGAFEIRPIAVFNPDERKPAGSA